ncbi:protein odr-4 homolog isoform X1 [Ptychodera flava]|uniref:protein odr-4 homolog isoform X1 n=1 Tax=Ptychodera flava TaxID=63121 RepID=UPI003969E6DA
MGRSVVAEEIVQTYVESMFGVHQWLFGLIIGQNSSQKDFAIQLIKTPSQDEDADSKEKAKNKARLDSIDEQWIAEHARQVSRMLPGGISIIGVFALAPPDMMNKSQAKLRQIIFEVRKTMKKQEILAKEDQVSERILLQICTVTRKTVCRTIDASDPKSTFRPAEWKYQPFINRWAVLQSRVSLDIRIPIIKVKASKSGLQRQIQNGLQPWCKIVSDSLTTIGGKLRKPSEQLDTTQSHKRKGTSSSSAGSQTFHVQLLSTFDLKSNGIVQKECTSQITLRGTVHGMAYVNNKATVSEATQFLKEDLINSLQSRCELLLEDLEQSEEGVHDVNILPRRVCVTLPKVSVNISDYMFQDEVVQDSLDRFSELLGLPITENQIQTDLECLPEEADLEMPKETIPVKADLKQREDEEDRGKSKSQYLNVAVSAAGAMLAVVMSYLLLVQDT